MGIFFVCTINEKPETLSFSMFWVQDVVGQTNLDEHMLYFAAAAAGRRQVK